MNGREKALEWWRSIPIVHQIQLCGEHGKVWEVVKNTGFQIEALWQGVGSPEPSEIERQQQIGQLVDKELEKIVKHVDMPKDDFDILSFDIHNIKHREAMVLIGRLCADYDHQ